MKNIGPTFVDELKAAGISLDGIAWGADGAIAFREDVLQPTRDAVLAVYAAHDPLKQTPSTDGTKEQRARALEALAASDPAAAKVVEVLKAGGFLT